MVVSVQLHSAFTVSAQSREATAIRNRATNSTPRNRRMTQAECVMRWRLTVSTGALCLAQATAKNSKQQRRQRSSTKGINFEHSIIKG